MCRFCILSCTLIFIGILKQGVSNVHMARKGLEGGGVIVSLTYYFAYSAYSTNDAYWFSNCIFSIFYILPASVYFTYYLLPAISDCSFQLRMDNICKVLILSTKTSIQRLTPANCTYISVLEEYKDHRRSGHILHILYIMYILNILHILHIVFYSVCLLHRLVGYKHSESAQILIFTPVSSIIGWQPLVPVGNRGAIHWQLTSKQRHAMNKTINNKHLQRTCLVQNMHSMAEYAKICTINRISKIYQLIWRICKWICKWVWQKIRR